MSEEPAERTKTSEVPAPGPRAPAGYGAYAAPSAQGTPPPVPPTPPPPPPAGPVYGPIQRYGHPTPELRGGSPVIGVSLTARVGAPPSGAWTPTAPPAPPPPTDPGLGYASWAPSPPPPGTWGPPGGPGGPGGPWPAPRRDDYASWGRRVGGAAIDFGPAWVALVVLVAGYLPTYLGFFRGDLAVPPRYVLVVVGSLLYVAAFGWAVYNRYALAGRTGQSVGKRVTKTWLVSRTTGRPIGPFNAFLRDLLHVLDAIGCVGYLWPLWDDERQTLADKLTQTVVVRTPVPPLTELERRRP